MQRNVSGTSLVCSIHSRSTKVIMVQLSVKEDCRIRTATQLWELSYVKVSFCDEVAFQVDVGLRHPISKSV
jgi:hypothetical protein